MRCAVCATTLGAAGVVASAVRCGGCTPLCTHCAEGAVTPFLCGHCLSVPGTEGADHVNCTKSFRLLGKKCPGFFVEFVRVDDVGAATWVRGTLLAVPEKGQALIDVLKGTDYDGELETVTITDLSDLKAVWRQPPPPSTPQLSTAEKAAQIEETRKRKSQRKIAGQPNTYNVERLLARQEYHDVDSYLVEFSGFGHEFTEWIPASDVTLRAIESFNPAPGAPGEHLTEMAASAASLEAYKMVAGGQFTVNEAEGVPFYNQIRFYKAVTAQQRALAGRRRKRRKVPPAARPASPAASPAASSAASTGAASAVGAAAATRAPASPDAGAKRKSSGTGSDSDNDADLEFGAPHPSAAKASRTSSAAVDGSPRGDSVSSASTPRELPGVDDRDEGTLTSPRQPALLSPSLSAPARTGARTGTGSKASATAPTQRDANAAATKYLARINTAAVASAAVLAAEAADRPALEKEADTAVAALKLPKKNQAGGGTTVAKHHRKSNLALCVAVPPRSTFLPDAAGRAEHWLCNCGVTVKLATVAKVKRHLITEHHLNTLKPAQRDDRRGGAAMEVAAKERGEFEIKVATLPEAIGLRVATMVAQKGYAFTAAGMTLRAVQSTIYDIDEGRPPGVDVIVALRRGPTEADLAAADALENVDSESRFGGVIAGLRRPPSESAVHAATVLSRVRELSVPRARSGGGSKPPLHMHRTCVSRNIRNKIEPAVDAMIDELLKKCVYVGLMLDESRSVSNTDPCYVGVEYCTADFEWGYHLVGQTDTSICTTGEELLENIKEVFTTTGREWLYDMILLGGTDGCPAMRSVRKYAGLHPRMVGKSLLRRLQADLALARDGPAAPVQLPSKLLFFHCVLHNVALALTDACRVLPPHVIPHIRSFHRVFHNKPKVWSELKKLCDEIGADMVRTNALLATPITNLALYRVTQFKSFSPTRWKDLLNVIASILDKWDGLKQLRDRRVEQGFGSPTTDAKGKSWAAPVTKKDRAAAAAAAAAADDDDDDDDDDDEDENTVVIDVDVSSEEEEEEGEEEKPRDINGIRLADHKGGDTDWKGLGNSRCTGHCGAHPVEDPKRPPKTKRTTLLSDGRGVTPLNHCINAVLADVLTTHVRLVKKLETRAQPVGHMAARWLRTYHRALDVRYITGAGNGGTYDAVYAAARGYYLDVNAGNEPEIVAAVDALAKTFAEALVSSSTARLEPYIGMLEALELADPSMGLPAGETGPRVWAAAKLLCDTVGIEFERFRRECIDMHTEYDDLPPADRTNCRQNLLRFYHNLAMWGYLERWPAARAFAVAVFTFPITTVFIECLFSAMKQNKSKGRASMDDDTVVAILKSRELTTVLTSDDPGCEPPLNLDLQSALVHNLS